jgi:murein DD-endopeptidase MepM/ murein hydrolase activator NlpD
MIPGSVAVKEGERVVRGQVLGRVGNSGNSSAPHLHMHVMDRNALFAANGLPYVFDSFDVTGRIASTDAFNRAEATGEPARLGRVRTGPRRNELALDQLIVTWPG